MRIGLLPMRTLLCCSSLVCAMLHARRAVSVTGALRRVVVPRGAHCAVRAVLWHVGSWGACCALRRAVAPRNAHNAVRAVLLSGAVL